MELKILKKKKVFKKGGIHINPNIYWATCLGVAFVFIISSAIFGVFLFKKTNQELNASPENNVSMQKIDQSRIEKALKYFTDRAEKSKQILISPVPVVDPSL